MKRLIVKVLTGVAALVLMAAGGRAEESVVLQQGVAPDRSYAGCRSATLWPKAPPAVPAAGVLHLRGENNRMLLRFDLPAPAAGRRLARATLSVFVPEARMQDRYCEILCRGMRAPWGADATWTEAAAGRPWAAAGGDADRATDYRNGRPPGAVDSCELYATNHPYWFNLMAHLPAGIPAGGMWLDFNVTPLAERWLTDPASNHGVMLMPIRIEDQRMSNPWEIDIPSERATDAAHRPRLRLEYAAGEAPVQLAVIPPLRRVHPWSDRYRYRGGYASTGEVFLAANEHEGFQVVVNPVLRDLDDVQFTWDDLVGDGGRRLPKERVTWFCEGSVKLNTSWLVRDMYFGGKRYTLPDPLVPATLAPPAWKRVARHQATAFWFDVHAPTGTPPGRYRTRLTLTANGCAPVAIDLTVNVWDFEIPVKWNFGFVGQFGEQDIPRFYGKDFRPEWLDRWYDFLLDHRVAPVQQYTSRLSPPAERIAHCVERGLNVIYVTGDLKPNSDMEQVRRQYETVEKMGLLDLAVLYVEDEGQQQEMRRALSRKVRAACPGAMMMVGGAPPHPDVIGRVDIWDPEIDGWPGDKLSAAQGRKIVEECQARGELFYWYVAAAPTAPYPNVQMEYPLIGARSFLWMSWKYRVTGTEYYCYNLWAANMGKPNAASRWPAVPWDPRSFKEYNGDGCLYYPGPDGTPCPSVRLEALRDGMEDWECFYILRDYADALRAEGGKAALLAEADRMLDVPDDVVTSVTTWSQDPDLMMKTRRQLGDLIVRYKKVVPAAAYTKVRDARHAAELDRRRSMITSRVAAAEQEQKTGPAPAPKSDAPPAEASKSQRM